MRVDVEEDVGKPFCFFHSHDVVVDHRRSVVSCPDWVFEDMKLQCNELWDTTLLDKIESSCFLFLAKSAPASNR